MFHVAINSKRIRHDEESTKTRMECVDVFTGSVARLVIAGLDPWSDGELFPFPPWPGVQASDDSKGCRRHSSGSLQVAPSH
jgi:CYTH domain-containing protein